VKADCQSRILKQREGYILVSMPRVVSQCQTKILGDSGESGGELNFKGVSLKWSQCQPF